MDELSTKIDRIIVRLDSLEQSFNDMKEIIQAYHTAKGTWVVMKVLAAVMLGSTTLYAFVHDYIKVVFK